jgi:hypothetical protein
MVFVMLLLRLGAKPARRVGILLALGASVLAAGCASSSNTQNRTYAQASVAAYPGKQPAVEDDGMPSQLPPARRTTKEPDDPREPFSPNYGKVSFNPGDSMPFIDVPRKLDPDTVIAQAILAHELRYR